METVHAQLASCLSFMRESLRTGSQGEVMKMKKAVVKEMTDNFKPDMLSPCELANVKFKATPKLTQACQQFGDVYLSTVSPYATGKGLEIAKLGERATAVLHIVDQLQTPIETLICKLVPSDGLDCSFWNAIFTVTGNGLPLMCSPSTLICSWCLPRMVA